MVLVPTGRNVRFRGKQDQFQRHFVPVLVKELLPLEVGLKSPLIVTQPELKENFHQRSQGAFLVDGHADSADSRVGLSQQPAPGLLVAAGHVACVRLSSGQQSGGSGIIPRGQGRLGKPQGDVPSVGAIVGSQESGTHGLEPFDLRHVFLHFLFQKGQGGKDRIVENVEIPQRFEKAFLVLRGDLLVLAYRRDPGTYLPGIDGKRTQRALLLPFLGLVQYPNEIYPVFLGEENPRIVSRVSSVLIVIPLSQFVKLTGLGVFILLFHPE